MFIANYLFYKMITSTIYECYVKSTNKNNRIMYTILRNGNQIYIECRYLSPKFSHVISMKIEIAFKNIYYLFAYKIPFIFIVFKFNIIFIQYVLLNLIQKLYQIKLLFQIIFTKYLKLNFFR